MRSRILCVASLAALIAGIVPLASPAAAQSNAVATNPVGAQPTPVAPRKLSAAEREAQSRARARVTVEKRSFLDAGVEVKPGQRKFTDYAFPPGYSPTSSIDFTSGNIRGPLVGPWDTSRNNFWPW
jgi:hypothetical protein